MNAAPPGAAPDAAAEPRRGPPCLWFTRLPLRELLETIRARHFAALEDPLQVQFAEQRLLAETDEQGAALLLSLHQVLNHAETPAEVFGTLFKRALAGVARARKRRRVAARGPAFFALCPEEPYADAWLDHHLGRCLRRPPAPSDPDERRRRPIEPEVRAGWRPLWLAPRPPVPTLELKRVAADAELQKLLRPPR